MSSIPLSSAGLDPRRRRILFRAWRRGLREMDLALGQFADAHLTELGEEELARVRASGSICPIRTFWPGSPARRRRRRNSTRRCSRGCARRPGSAASGEIGLVNAPVALAHRLRRGGAVTLARAPEGFDAFVVADLTRALAREAESRAVALTFVARDSLRAQSFIDALAFAAPEIEALYLPGWDCQPYDRVSPNAAIAAQRMTALARLALTRGAAERPRVLVATVNAMTQRVPPKAFVASAALSAAPGNSAAHGGSRASGWNPTGFRARPWCATSAITRSAAAFSISRRPARPRRAARFLRRHAGIDPLVRSGDAAQRRPAARARSGADERGAAHHRDDPPLSPGLRRRIRRAATRRFALRDGERGPARDRPRALAAAVPRAARHACSTMSRTRRVVLDARAEEAADARFAQIADYYAARKTGNETDPAHADYRPLKPDRLYLDARRMARAARGRPARAADAVRGRAGRARRHRLRRPGRARLRARAAERERQRVRGGGRACPGAARARASGSSSRAGATARASG